MKASLSMIVAPVDLELVVHKKEDKTVYIWCTTDK